MLNRLIWVCQVDAPSTVSNHPSIGGPATLFTFATSSGSTHYGNSPRNVFDNGFEFADIDKGFDDIFRNPLAKISELQFSISALNSWYATLCEANATDETFFLGWRVRLWAQDGVIPGLAFNGTNWTDLDANVITFTPSNPYPLTDTYLKLFDGVISDIKGGFNLTEFTAEEDNILRGKVSGSIVTGRENKIAPIVIGNMNDSDSFIPAVFPNSITTDSGLVCTSGATILGINLYSSSAERSWPIGGTLVQSGGVLTGIDTGASGSLLSNIGGAGGGDSSMDSARNASIDGGSPFYALFPANGEVISECAKKDSNRSLAYDLSGSAPQPSAQGFLNAAFSSKPVEVSRGALGTSVFVQNAGTNWVGQDPPKSAFFTLTGSLYPKEIAIVEAYDALGWPMYTHQSSKGALLVPDPPAPTTFKAFEPATETTAEFSYPLGCGISGDWIKWRDAQTTNNYHSSPLIFSPIPHADWVNPSVKISNSLFSSRLKITWEEIGFNGLISKFSVMCGTRGRYCPYSVVGINQADGRVIGESMSYQDATNFYRMLFGKYTSGTDASYVFPWAEGVFVDFDGDYRKISTDLQTLTHAQRLDSVRNQVSSIRTTTYNPLNKKTSDITKTSLVVRGVGAKHAYPDGYELDNFWGSQNTFTLQTQIELHFVRMLFNARVEVKEDQVFSRSAPHASGATMANVLSVFGLSGTGLPTDNFASGIVVGSPQNTSDLLRTITRERTSFCAIALRNSIQFKDLGSATIAKTFNSTSVLLGGDNLPACTWSISGRRDLVTSVIVRYRYDHARGKYSRSVVLDANGARSSHANVTGSDCADAVLGLIKTANKIGQGATEQIDCQFLRDDLSAVRLAVWTANQLSQPRYSVTLTTHLNEIIGLEIGSIVKVDLPSIPTRLKSAKYIVTGLNLSQSVQARITLTEVF
jgi:hypothetical protein